MLRLYTVLLSLFFAAGAMAAPPATWGTLTPGRHPVGFELRIELDTTRPYGASYQCAAGCSIKPRPIVLAIWYPAEVPPGAPTMNYGDYLDIPSSNAELKPFIARLSRYNREEVIRYALEQSPEVPLSAAAKEQLRRLLAMPMAAVRGAPQRGGRFPLVLYHSGLGGTIDENAVLAEYLASHGYVVVASAFQAEDATVLNIDWDLERSKRDLTFVLRSMLAWPQVDASRVAVMGQSFGAQSALSFAMANQTLSAVISIDSTIENAPPDHPFVRMDRFRYHLDRENDLHTPLLAFATHDRGWWFLDKFKYSDRYYITLEEIEHSDSTSQGQLGRLVAPDSREALPRNAQPPRLQYERLCSFILGFLEARFMTSEKPFEPKEAPGLHVHHKTALSPPPKGYQIAEWLLREGPERMGARCAELRRVDSLSCDSRAMQAGADYLESQERRNEAISLLSVAVQQFPAEIDHWDALGCAHLRSGARDKAIAAFQAGLARAGSNDSKARLKKRLVAMGVQLPPEQPPAKPK